MKKVVKFVWIVDDKDVEGIVDTLRGILLDGMDGENLEISEGVGVLDYDVVIRDEKKDELKTMEELMSVLRN